MLQLTQIGLQFDESKSENPICLLYCGYNKQFYSCIELRKEKSTIRDDILESAGLNPSYTRQTENELAKPEPI